MQIKIKNFARIENATIDIEGITVIAGTNNTGKSTVGKIVFSIFNSLNQIDRKIKKQRLEEIKINNKKTIELFIAETNVSRVRASREAFTYANRINNELWRYVYSVDDLKDVPLEECIRNATHGLADIIENYEKYEGLIKVLYDNSYERLNVSEDKVVRLILTEFFSDIFGDQIKNLIHSADDIASVEYTIKNKTDHITFENNICTDFTDTIGILHKAICIDDPFVLDSLSEKEASARKIEGMLVQLLNSSWIWDEINGNMNGVIESVLSQEKLEKIFEKLKEIVPGKIFVDKNGKFCLDDDKFSEPIKINNLSAGIKSFVVLKMLLEKGCIEKQDVLILDEPEVHLHPEWQVAYAELIVLLQREFELSVIVTTHSPYFLDAIDLFSKKYGTRDKANFYLSEVTYSGGIQIEDVGDSVEQIYQKMVSPIELLDTLRYELENN